MKAELSNYEARRGDNIGALLHRLGTLQSHETRRIITQFGQAENFEAAWPDIQRYRVAENVEHALNEMAAFWEEYLSCTQVETPEMAMNAMLNAHNPRQVFITMNWSRYLSLYQLGFGARGLGFRDSSQDVMGMVANSPERALTLIEKLLHVQKRNGSAMHQFNPLSMIASIGDAHEMEDRPSYYGDDHLWIVLATAAYLKETGDLDFLKKIIPFYEKDQEGLPIESGDVFKHLKRAIEFTHSHVGAHGLPLAGFADWNDTVNLRTGAESLFNANLYGRALLELIALCEEVTTPTLSTSTGSITKKCAPG
jgi:cellobiose phosphorylase